MIEMLYVLITFDYELYLVKNFGSGSTVLFEPAEKIVDVLGAENVKATFYADVCSAIRHEELGFTDYSKCFKNQLQNFYKNGNDVQLHIHPHWLTSEYKNDEWIFDKNKYALSGFAYDEDIPNNVFCIVENAMKYLNVMMTEKFPSYKCVSYRAGGYSLEPYEKLIPFLRSRGILIDSSVAMFTKSAPGATQRYDYTHLPEVLNWWINPSCSLVHDDENEDHSDSLFELPIAYYKQRLADRILLGKDKMTYKLGQERGKGLSSDIPAPHKQSLIRKAIDYGKTYKRLSLDFMSADLLLLALERIRKKYDTNNKDCYVAIIGHPKGFTGDAFENMRRFVKIIKERNDKYRLLTISDLYERIK